MGSRRDLAAAALVGVVGWAAATGCGSEETGERSRFEDDASSAAQTGAGGLMTTVTTGNGVGGAGAGQGGGSSPTTGAGGAACDYDAPNSCLSADTLTAIAGDAGTDLRVVRGTTARFVKVFVAETVGSVISFPDLKFAARLDNSPSMDFDLKVYVGDDEPHCDGQTVTATTEPAVVVGTWEDQLNNDDGRWIIFEVAYVGGTACGSAAEWTLTIAGNHAFDCDTNGVCDGDDDCVCPDCDSHPSCAAPGSCDDDGTCDTTNEGCGCADCEGTPACL